MPLDPDLLLFWAKKAAALLVLPPLGPLLLIMLGLLRRGRGRRLAWLGLASAWFFSAPATVGWMLDALERTPSPTMDQLSGAQAIVILAGGLTYAVAALLTGAIRIRDIRQALRS